MSYTTLLNTLQEYKYYNNTAHTVPSRISSHNSKFPLWIAVKNCFPCHLSDEAECDGEEGDRDDMVEKVVEERVCLDIMQARR